MIHLLLLPILILCSTAYAQQPVDSFDLQPPANPESLRSLDLWATEYYVHQTDSAGTIPYLSPAGDTLGYFSDTCDFCTACLEGTVFIETKDGDDRVVLNYASTGETALVNCRECKKFEKSTLNVEAWGRVRWKVSQGFGEGVHNYKLVPFRTIAVDPNTIPYGSVVFIRAAVGTNITQADGSTFTHDGYFFTGDTGGAIKKNHIDVFTGSDESHPFDFVKSSASYTVKAQLVKDASIIKILTDQHK